MNSPQASLRPDAGCSQGQLTPHPRMFTSQLPQEVWNITFGFSSLEARAAIVSVNRWFYNAFGRTLYQDIYIHTPLQLVKLDKFWNLKAAGNLGETQRLTIDRRVLWKENWRGRPGWLDSAACFGRVLQMTTSLHELRVEGRYSPGSFRFPDCESEDHFKIKIIELASSPSFLPHLTRIQCPRVWLLASLCEKRPIEYLSSIEEEYLAANLLGNRLHPAGASPTRISLDTSTFQDFDRAEPSTLDVALLLEQVSFRKVTVRHLRVLATHWRANPSLANLPSWVMWMTSKSGHEHIESLCIIFEPPILKKPMEVQLRTLAKVTRKMPNLAYATLGSTGAEWRRLSGERSELPSRVPDWTPRPNHHDPAVLSWWLDTLEPRNATKAWERDLEGVRQLRGSMLTRWDETLVPSIQELRTGLLDMDFNLVQG
ncbi:hypothetical protein FS749_006000 [Ceratobasidium sp. UAMH 11750]|nr:hypothetical protein FS749_006000 [Ceratobasidium sp. UAMH 11750]